MSRSLTTALDSPANICEAGGPEEQAQPFLEAELTFPIPPTTEQSQCFCPCSHCLSSSSQVLQPTTALGAADKLTVGEKATSVEL